MRYSGSRYISASTKSIFYRSNSIFKGNNSFETQAINRQLSTSIDIKPLTMPSLSPTMTHGTISTWLMKPGDKLGPGDILCEIETDKASVGYEVQDDGVLAKILVEAKGSELKVGEPIALIVEDEAAYKIFLTLPADASAYTSPSNASDSTSSAPPAGVNTTAGVEVRLSPAARHMVESLSLDISKVIGTSKGGIISKSDLLEQAIKNKPAIAKHTATAATAHVQAVAPAAHVSVSPSAPVPSVSLSTEPVNDKYTDIPNSNMRKVIAKRLTESKATVPHFYTTIECEIDNLLALRKVFKKDFDVNVSVNDLVIKSAALALRDVPRVNAKWDKVTCSAGPSGGDIDISVAVATPNGLITPIVKGADKRGISDINSLVKDLATRARDGKLKPEEYQGGSFSISNLGMFGISSFSAVINPPQACILAVGAGVARVVPAGDGKGLKVVTSLAVQLSADRRVVDEATAGQFLQVFRAYINDPKTMML